MRKTALILTPILALAVNASALGGEVRTVTDDDVVIRDSSSVYTVHDRHRPLTSTYLDTTSTRLVDARRGYRPYDTIHDEGYRGSRYASRRVYRDTYGPIRPIRSYVRNTPPAPRTSVTAFYGGDRDAAMDTRQADAPRPIMIIVRDERGTARDADREVRAAPAEDRPAREVMEVTVYEGEPEMPKNSGAVIVRSDGTVISVGD